MVEISVRIIGVPANQAAVVVQFAVLSEGGIGFHGRGRMVWREINNDFDAFGMGGGHQILKIGHGSEIWIGLLEIPCPIAVISRVGYTAVVDGSENIFDRLGDPEGCDTQVTEIVIIDFVNQPLPVAAAVQLQVAACAIKGSAGRVVGWVTIQKPVRKT